MELVRRYTLNALSASSVHQTWTRPYKRALATRLAPVTPGEYHTLPGRLVVSLTSHRSQFRMLSLTLRSLLSQDAFPDLMVLWVGYDDFERLPHSVSRLQYHGLLIKQCADIGPYKAIVPTIETYPHAFIVTAGGGNAYYPPDWLRTLIEAYEHPGEILCRSAQRPTLEAPFAEWETLSQDGETGDGVFFTSASGVLFPPGTLAPEVTDEDEFMRLCPGNADIWLNWMAVRVGTPVRLVAPLTLMDWPDPLSNAPWRRRRPAGEEDRQITAMIEAYGLSDRPRQAQRAAAGRAHAR